MFAVQFFVNSFSYRLFAEANYNNSAFCSHSTFKACFTLTVTIIQAIQLNMFQASYTTQFSSIHKEFREFIQIEVVPGAPQQSQVFRCGRCWPFFEQTWQPAACLAVSKQTSCQACSPSFESTTDQSYSQTVSVVQQALMSDDTGIHACCLHVKACSRFLVGSALSK